MKALITGANGQLGRALQETAPANVEIIAAGSAELDIGDANAVTAFVSQHEPNLILNAAEAMQQGGTLQIATKVTEQGVTVAFTDSGSGMTEEQRERAFTGMLSTTKEKGGGLGLAIVAKVAEAHGGRVEVQSAPGEGTRIQFRLSR